MDKVVDPQDLVVDYGKAGEKPYVLVSRMFRPNGERVETYRTVVFQSASKSEVIFEAQRRKGWEPVDGSESTYGKQIVDHNGEAR
jgi:hypothetical protein